jgi:1,4-dihydroxy-2-naphthoyl-CoA synthase
MDVRNAFRPKTTAELYNAFYDAGRYVNRVVLLSAGPSSKDGVYSFAAVAIKTHADIKDMWAMTDSIV